MSRSTLNRISKHPEMFRDAERTAVIMECLEQAGAVVILKADGLRKSKRYTCLISNGGLERGALIKSDCEDAASAVWGAAVAWLEATKEIDQ